jgi:RNA-directed DNA polymerase
VKGIINLDSIKCLSNGDGGPMGMVRMAYWRQWRKPRTKVRNLMSRGVHVQAAVACGTTSKGPWRSSKTPGINQALSNAYLKSQGLYELRDGWIKLHHS